MMVVLIRGLVSDLQGRLSITPSRRCNPSRYARLVGFAGDMNLEY